MSSGDVCEDVLKGVWYDTSLILIRSDPWKLKKTKGGILKQTLVIGSQGQGFCKINKKKKYNDGCKNSELFMITEYSSKIHNLS